MHAGIRLEQCLCIDVLEYRAVAGAEPWQRIAKEILLPIADRTHAVDQDETADAGPVAFSGEHREPTAPGVTENVPGANAERFANRRQVAGIVLDASGPGSGRRLRRTATSLVVEDELTALGQGSESGPQQIVIEQQSAVHTHERCCTVYLRREVHSELEPACANGASYQARRSRARASKGDEPFAGGDLRKETAATR